MNTSYPTLYTYSKDCTKLTDALSNFVILFGEEIKTVGILYAPDKCSFVRLERDGKVTNEQGKELNIDRVFEARLFNSEAELRWLNESNGLGKAIVVSRQDKKDKANYFEFSEPLKTCGAICQSYLLWGEGYSESDKQMQEGWSCLAEARIGKIYVPINGVAKKGERVLLKAVEYLRESDEENGNVIVFEELLTGLEVTYDYY
ncbi:MAG: TIGR03984 family CRISPR-associated protein [Blastocatellia bacterium]|nr:TIGR03984 family CRISPR-associated protein [Blastocatellia bacterium]